MYHRADSADCFNGLLVCAFCICLSPRRLNGPFELRLYHVRCLFIAAPPHCELFQQLCVSLLVDHADSCLEYGANLRTPGISTLTATACNKLNASSVDLNLLPLQMRLYFLTMVSTYVGENEISRVCTCNRLNYLSISILIE